MADKQTRDTYYERLLNESLKRHVKHLHKDNRCLLKTEIDWSKLDNFIKTKHNEQSSRTNDSNS
jgi:hypothetical protein